MPHAWYNLKKSGSELLGELGKRETCASARQSVVGIFVKLSRLAFRLTIGSGRLRQDRLTERKYTIKLFPCVCEGRSALRILA
jgi:hypothetical protein